MTHDPHPGLAAFEVLIGTWSTEATHPLFDGVVHGETTFEWLDAGRHFLVQRSRQDHVMFPDGLIVVGPDEDGELVGEYFDERGVRRTWRTSLQDGVWRWSREHPGFDQRFEARVAPREFHGVSQLAREPGAWKDDLEVTYRRRD